MFPCKKILCPTDFSPASFEALRAADELASRFSSKLLLVHAVLSLRDRIMPLRPSAVPTDSQLPVTQQHLEETAREGLENAAREHLSDPSRAHPYVVRGEPEEAILEVADREDADLIVIATHGRTGYRRVLMGSTAEKVIRLSPCPVLTVRVSGASTAETG